MDQFPTLFYRPLMARLELDRPSIRPSDKFSVREILRSIRSPHVIISFILLFMQGTTIGGLALFLPSIVSELGFSRSKAQLLTVGPFFVGFFGAFIRYTSRQKPTLPTLYGYSCTNVRVPIRPLPIERYNNSLDCHRGGCGIFDVSR